jgi:S-adenosylmethionine:diacylglycerol 3-amino-3-carboxypropyl transferase
MWLDYDTHNLGITKNRFLKLGNEYPAYNSYFFIVFFFGNFTNQNRPSFTFCLTLTKIAIESEGIQFATLNLKWKNFGECWIRQHY